MIFLLVFLIGLVNAEFDVFLKGTQLNQYAGNDMTHVGPFVLRSDFETDTNTYVYKLNGTDYYELHQTYNYTHASPGDAAPKNHPLNDTDYIAIDVNYNSGRGMLIHYKLNDTDHFQVHETYPMDDNEVNSNVREICNNDKLVVVSAAFYGTSPDRGRWYIGDMSSGSIVWDTQNIDQLEYNLFGDGHMWSCEVHNDTRILLGDSVGNQVRIFDYNGTGWEYSGDVPVTNGGYIEKDRSGSGKYVFFASSTARITDNDFNVEHTITIPGGSFPGEGSNEATFYDDLLMYGDAYNGTGNFGAYHYDTTTGNWDHVMDLGVSDMPDNGLTGIDTLGTEVVVVKDNGYIHYFVTSWDDGYFGTIYHERVTEYTASPTAAPTGSPTTNPTGTPTTSPTGTPTNSPVTAAPTSSPSASPTTSPSAAPTNSPVTAAPTGSPTASPTASPTTNSTGAPTGAPTTSPTGSPSRRPTDAPTESPTGSPSASAPTPLPTGSPTTESPTPSPTTGTPTTGTPTTKAPTTKDVGSEEALLTVLLVVSLVVIGLGSVVLVTSLLNGNGRYVNLN